MKNKFSDGSPLDIIVPAGGCTSGTALLVNGIVGIPETTQLIGDTVALHVTGLFDHASDTGAAWAVGDVLYWDNTAKVFTKTTTSNTKAGQCVLAKLSATATGRIRLQPSF